MNVDLGPLRERLAADALDLAAQQALLAELVKHSDNVDHMATVRGLLAVLRSRSDVAASVARDADALLATLPFDDGDEARAPRQRRPLSEHAGDGVRHESAAQLRTARLPAQDSLGYPLVEPQPGREGDQAMVDEQPNAARRPLPWLGFRRIEFVDVVVDERGARASVTGVAHRLPHTVRVSLRTARELIEAGVPSRIDGLPQGVLEQLDHGRSD